MSKKNIGSSFDELLSENDISLTLTTLASAAAVSGKKANVELVAAWNRTRCVLNTTTS